MQLSPTAAVLVSKELLPLLGRFQDGLHFDILPFRVLTATHSRLKPSSFDPLVMDTIQGLVRPWLAQHGHTRLKHMCASSIVRRHVMLLFGAYNDDVDLLCALAALAPLNLFGPTCQYALPLVELAVVGGAVAAIEYLVALDYPYSPSLALKLAVTHGHLALVPYMAHLCQQHIPHAMYMAAPLKLAVKDDNVDMLRCLLPCCTTRMLSEAVRVAIEVDATQCLRVLILADTKALPIVQLYSRASDGHSDLLDRLMEIVQDHIPQCIRELIAPSLSGAIHGDQFALVHRLLELTPNDDVIQPAHLMYAVTRNCVAVVHLFCERRGQWRRSATVTWERELPALALGAARHGQLAMVQCLITNDDQEAIDWRMILYEAARVRAAPIVKWLVASQPVVDVQTLHHTLCQATAVSHSHLKRPTLEILHEIARLLPPTYCLPTSFLLAAATTCEPYVFEFLFGLWWHATHDNPKAKRTAGHACLLSMARRGKLGSVEMLVKEFEIDVTLEDSKLVLPWPTLWRTAVCLVAAHAASVAESVDRTNSLRPLPILDTRFSWPCCCSAPGNPSNLIQSDCRGTHDSDSCDTVIAAADNRPARHRHAVSTHTYTSSAQIHDNQTNQCTDYTTNDDDPIDIWPAILLNVFSDDDNASIGRCPRNGCAVGTRRVHQCIHRLDNRRPVHDTAHQRAATDRCVGLAVVLAAYLMIRGKMQSTTPLHP
ncbi:Aste57867_18919 [Aphanomyces stellatus]|uniref:Aste57867_18919 protein n=1 Tax=Aphanomyces stellatus TaxID=120398 RepID=A0A485LBA7_9STRA|nr:hypothetical protein As57867_018855 [Aphanomyces stellatus]VFT95651.1 Aste57867_18919 [Aphanomyces stellatus]